jgi:hypothetical protein
LETDQCEGIKCLKILISFDNIKNDENITNLILRLRSNKRIQKVRNLLTNNINYFSIVKEGKELIKK